MAATRRRLSHLARQLEEVEPWPTGRPVPTFTFGRINERYRSALAIARLILEHRSLEFPEQRQHGTGFVFDMNRLFEEYLEAALRTELERFGGTVRGQQHLYLDEAANVLMKPDITWWVDGQCRAVIDAKYK